MLLPTSGQGQGVMCISVGVPLPTAADFGTIFPAQENTSLPLPTHYSLAKKIYVILGREGFGLVLVLVLAQGRAGDGTGAF